MCLVTLYHSGSLDLIGGFSLKMSLMVSYILPLWCFENCVWPGCALGCRRFLVSYANLTRIKSKGYVKNTDAKPDKEPDINLLPAVSYKSFGMRICLICSYATNLIAAYGNIRNNVIEWPWYSPHTPSLFQIRLPASIRPRKVPLYLINSGFDVWKRIFIRSKGATSVFAQEPATPPAIPSKMTYCRLCLSMTLILSMGVDWSFE